MSFLRLEPKLIRVRKYLDKHRADRVRRRDMARPFSPGASSRLLLVTQHQGLPQSQVYPFHYYATDLQRLYGTEVREADLRDFLTGRPGPATGATAVAFQTGFDVADETLQQSLAEIDAAHPGARIALLDWSAPTDLRNAARLNDKIDVYIKKHVLRDRSLYGKPTLGDTNLTDHYARRFGLPEPERQFPVPSSFLDKLVVGSSFATAPTFLSALQGKRPPARGAVCGPACPVRAWWITLV